MNSRQILAFLVAPAALTLVVADTSSAVARVAPVGVPQTTIASLPIQTCADVNTALVPGFYGYVYGAACTGTSTQNFQFHPITSAPAGTFQITNVSSKQCLIQYSNGVKQNPCSGSVPPDASNTEWTLTRVGTTGFAYRFAVTSTLATAAPTCLQVGPKPASHPGPVLLLQACDPAQPDQVLTLTIAP